MDKIEKALNRLSSKVRQKIKSILLQIERGNFRSLDLKKLKGRKDIFRVRKGNLRIIIHKIDDSIKVLSIEHRSSKIYRMKSIDNYRNLGIQKLRREIKIVDSKKGDKK